MTCSAFVARVWRVTCYQMWRRCGVCSEQDVKWQVNCRHNVLHAIITSRIAGGEPLVTATSLKHDE